MERRKKLKFGINFDAINAKTVISAFDNDCKVSNNYKGISKSEITFTEHADGAEWAPHVPPAAAAANALLPGT